MDLTVRDWEKIGRSPVLVFLAVAKADSSISGQEVASYAEDFLPRVQDFEVSPDVARQDTRDFLEDAEERALIQRVP